MMGRWTIRETLLSVVGFLLACSVCYYVGKKQGQLDEKLSSNKAQIAVQDSVTNVVTSKVDSAKKRDAVLDSTHDVVRSKVRVVHDTLYVTSDIDTTSDPEAIYSPQIAKLIATDDSLISAQKHELALRDTLEASLRRGISLRDDRIKLLESQGNPRFSRGLQAGLGYCATATGNTPCAYVGYGISLRIP